MTLAPTHRIALALVGVVLSLVVVLAGPLTPSATLGASPPEPPAAAPAPTGPTPGCAPTPVVAAAYRSARAAEIDTARRGVVDRLGDHFAGPALILARRAWMRGSRPVPSAGRLEVVPIDEATVMVTEHRRRSPDRAAVLRCGPKGWRITEAVMLP